MVKAFRKKWESFWNHYGKSISYSLTVLTVMLSLIGSYQYYTGYVSNVVPERLWSSIAYSTLKLYLFSPTVGPGEATPLCYEIAKWLAPLCTAYWVFKALESLVWHGVGLLKRRISSKKQMVIFGYNENSLTFIDHVYHENLENADPKKDVLIILVTEQTLEREEILKLERKEVVVYQMDFLEDNNLKMMDDFKKLKLWKVDEIVLFYDDATLNFTIFTRMIKLIHDSKMKHWSGDMEGSITCAFQCKDSAVKKVVTSYYGEPKLIGESESLAVESSEMHTKSNVVFNPFNLKVFSLPDLAVEQALFNIPLYENCLPEPLSPLTGGEKRFDSYMKQIKNPHLLIAGFGTYGQAFFEKALLTGTLSDRSQAEGYIKLRITVIDTRAEHYKNILYSRYPRLDKICTVEFLNLDVCGSNFEQKLDQLPMFTYAAVCFGNQTTSILTMMQLAKYSFIRAKGSKIPIVTRMEKDGAMVQYIRDMTATREEQIENYKYVVPFGARKQLLTREHLINPAMEKEAEQFHQAYERQASAIYADKPIALSQIDPWSRLDFERKESNRVLVLNKPYFKELLKRLHAALPDETLVLAKGQDQAIFLREIEDGNILDILASLEHVRWCNFCYTYGYAGYDKQEKRVYRKVEENGEAFYGKVHNCLVDDWRMMKSVPKLRDTIKFDLCSIYRYMEL